MTKTNAGDTWVPRGETSVCDTSAGEVYLKSSPGRDQSLEQCQQKCVDEPACNSITHRSTGWCSHYSTSCDNVKKANRVTSYKLVRAVTTTATTTEPTTTTTTTKTITTTTTKEPTTSTVATTSTTVTTTAAGSLLSHFCHPRGMRYMH